ncbi:MAG: PD40 domain-containing protein [Anaerolineae bacterium]|nr:PD40 domain-containing protein [Anaerolineae bacterium]
MVLDTMFRKVLSVLLLSSIVTLLACQPALRVFPTGEIFTFAVAPKGKYLALGGLQGVYYYRLSDLQLVWAKCTHYAVESLTFDPTGEQLLGRLADEVDTILLWRVQDGRQLRKWELNFSTPQSTPLNWSPDGENILLERDADDLLLLNVISNQQYTVARENHLGVGTGRHDILFGSAWSPDGRLLAFGTYDATIELWDVPHNILVSTLPSTKTYFTTGLAFDPTGTKLASNSFTQEGLVWDIATSTVLLELEDPPMTYLDQQTTQHTSGGGLLWSPDGKWLISGTQSGILVVWDATTGKITRFLSGHTAPILALSFRPGNGTILSASQNELLEWDVVTGQLLPTFQPLFVPQSP